MGFLAALHGISQLKNRHIGRRDGEDSTSLRAEAGLTPWPVETSGLITRIGNSVLIYTLR